VIQLILCCEKPRRDIIDYFYISSLTPVPPMTPNPIMFVSQTELYLELISNNDKFYDTFYDYDWKARKVSSLDQYKDNIRQAVSSFTEEQQTKLKQCTKQCDDFLMTVNIAGFDNIKASNIPWKIGRVKGRLYEYGLPHTRHDDLIVLSDENINDDVTTLTRTLIHEKIHLYQKQNTEENQKYLEMNNFEKYKRREYSDLIRANPDVDNWIYKNKVTGLLYKCQYNSMNPENIMDVKNTNQLFEHPFEKLAVMVGQMYSSTK
jgi:flavodoxin